MQLPVVVAIRVATAAGGFFPLRTLWARCGVYFRSPFFMTPKKKDGSVDTEQTATEAAATKKPLKVFLVDDVSASVFEREYLVKGEMRTFYSVSFSRSYRDSAGAWKYIKSFNLEDLGKVVSCAQQADEYIRSLVNEAGES